MNFLSIMMAKRNKELAAKRKKKEQSCNKIMHGKEESN